MPVETERFDKPRALHAQQKLSRQLWRCAPADI